MYNYKVCYATHSGDTQLQNVSKVKMAINEKETK